jgi:hypothetical protein
MPIFAASTGETMSTYATLDADLYTPTKDKPYQGIWVGDYSAHGCEFLLVIQRDNPEDDSDNPDARDPRNDDIIQRGSLEAVKLTGDPNVPRGQLSFKSDDIGSRGTVRIATEALFEGARVVRSTGHVAGLGFRDGTLTYMHFLQSSSDQNRHVHHFATHSCLA